MCHKKIMRKRSNSHNISDEPPKKRISPGGNILPRQISPGEVLTDLTGKQWRLGKTLGYGGFGEIYLASDNIKDPVKNDAKYIIKVENHSSGPLFVEINCLLRIAKAQMINEWRQIRKINYLGIPHYVASGSHLIDNDRLRFLVLPRFEQDLEKILLSKQRKFNIKTVILVCTQILDTLEYIHSKGYVHCDIKASNILHSLLKVKTPPAPKPINRDCNPMRSCRYRSEVSHKRNLRPKRAVNYDEDSSDSENTQLESSNTRVVNSTEQTIKYLSTPNQVILIDYGLATKYRHSDGRHKQYCNDERKAHAGTILFCSIDAHLGATSRRSDLESLGYNMIYWLTSNLPWSEDVADPEIVQSKKQDCLNNLETFLKSCFQERSCPMFVYEYFKYVKSLTFEAEPDYSFCKKLFQTSLQEYGYKKDGCLDFNNLEGWGRSPKKSKRKSENKYMKKRVKTGRQPLTSNIIIEQPVLRKTKNKKKGNKQLNWSILSDPEKILRHYNKLKNNDVTKSRERKITENSDTSLQSMDIWNLNPTYAMLEVYNKYNKDKNANYNGVHKNGKGDGFDGPV